MRHDWTWTGLGLWLFGSWAVFFAIGLGWAVYRDARDKPAHPTINDMGGPFGLAGATFLIALVLTIL